MNPSSLTEAQEAEAQQLLRKLQDAAQPDLLALARLLVSKPEAEIFGATEFQARDLVHRIGAKAFQLHLAEKKTATGVPASIAPTAAAAPSSTLTAPERP
jgi:hypothetical protein